MDEGVVGCWSSYLAMGASIRLEVQDSSPTTEKKNPGGTRTVFLEVWPWTLDPGPWFLRFGTSQRTVQYSVECRLGQKWIQGVPNDKCELNSSDRIYEWLLLICLIRYFLHYAYISLGIQTAISISGTVSLSINRYNMDHSYGHVASRESTRFHKNYNVSCWEYRSMLDFNLYHAKNKTISASWSKSPSVL